MKQIWKPSAECFSGDVFVVIDNNNDKRDCVITNMQFPVELLQKKLQQPVACEYDVSLLNYFAKILKILIGNLKIWPAWSLISQKPILGGIRRLVLVIPTPIVRLNHGSK